MYIRQFRIEEDKTFVVENDTRTPVAVRMLRQAYNHITKNIIAHGS